MTAEASAAETNAAPAVIAPGTIDRSSKGKPAPAEAFLNPAGAKVTLADFKGRPLLVNLWATWCAPCVKEMPTLDALAGELQGKVQVLVVSQDLKGAEKVGPFFAERKFAHLQPYLDPDGLLGIAYNTNLPTTVLYDSQGREVWRMLGEADWTSADVKAKIAEAS
ncbi:TlpA family protein disulfide reductase [Sphingomonas canadensis]|uniref:TlpA family protein disulfide reductase n=1 Tax=Sphingomonas canadensis TaxID=1219257 RepID=A0ABW3H348_9SPHN|nr:TlpA disulfide reductase family protein [Sphingomonas canadensis]